MNNSYSTQLKNPKWQKKRLAIFERDNWTCQSCGDKEQTLHVHHIKYVKGKKPWEYEDSHLVTYCETCHETEHLIGGEIRSIFFEMLDAHKIYIRPLAQINILIENDETFYERLRVFLNESQIQYLASKTKAA